MTLLNDFFHITAASSEGAAATYTIALNPEHTIYKAHFPGNPITPGVCQVAIVEELMSEREGRPMHVAHIANIKYMDIIVPTTDPTLNVELSRIREVEGGTALQAVLRNDHSTFTKMSITLR